MGQRNGTKEVAYQEDKRLEEQDVIPQAALGDRIAMIRGRPPIAANMIPVVPKDAPIVAPGELSGSNMRFFADDQYAESLLAMEEVVQRRASLKAELGPNAPDPKIAAALIDRSRETRRSLVIARHLYSYLLGFDAVNRADIFNYIKSLHGEYSHFVQQNPGLATLYPALDDLMTERSSRISNGRTRAKREREAIVEAEKKGEEKAKP